MAGYIGSKAVNLSTTGADINGNANVDGTLDVTGAFTSLGIDDNATSVAVTIDASGNVGIGTSPLAALHVATSTTDYTGDVMISGTRPYLVLDDTTAAQNGFSFGVDGGVLTIGTGDFSTNTNVYGTERLRIDSSGNVLVGKTTTAVATAGTGIFSDGLVEITRNLNYGLRVNRTSNNGTLVRLDKNGTQVGSISTDGTSTAYNTTSDYRLKENITPVQGAADIVKMMQPCTYTFKSDGSWHDGFLAHELQELHPRAVIGEKDAMQDEEYEVTPAVLDDDGEVVTEAVMGTRSVPDYQGVDYSKLTPILTAALKEALTKIEVLEAQNATFETRLAALEATP